VIDEMPMRFSFSQDVEYRDIGTVQYKSPDMTIDFALSHQQQRGAWRSLEYRGQSQDPIQLGP